MEDSVRKVSVLVVDDSRAHVASTTALLQRLGLTANSETDPIKAVELVRQLLGAGNPPDMIFLDIRMPGLNGIEAAKQLRAAGYKGVIIAFTIEPTMVGKKESKNAGIDGYFNKTVLKPELVEAIIKEYCKG